MTPTNFQNVAQLNQLIGNVSSPEKVNWEAIEKQFKLIQSEFNELALAIESQDKTETIDGIADVLVTTYGLGYILGRDCDKDMIAVHESNMSKFCHSEEEAQATENKYADYGMITSRRYILDVIAIVSGANQPDHKGEVIPKGKLLKSVNFKEPVFL